MKELRRDLLRALALLWEGPKRGAERERRRAQVEAARDRLRRKEAELRGRQDEPNV